MSCLTQSNSFFTEGEIAMVVCFISLSQQNYISAIEYLWLMFRTTRWDYLLFIGAMIVFLWAFFFDSFKPVMLPDGTIGMSLNMQVFICPVILIYSVFIIFFSEGMPRIRDLNKRLLLIVFIGKIRDKWTEGMDEYREWMKQKPKRK